jgi:nucleoside-diphosphate-sugar epimerase
MKAFVTGGAGFIGSHVVDRLIQDGRSVTVFDNLSTGFEENLAAHAGSGLLTLHRGDVLDAAALTSAMEGHDMLFHFQANADVRGGIKNTRADLEQNTIGTWNALEAARLALRLFFFASQLQLVRFRLLEKFCKKGTLRVLAGYAYATHAAHLIFSCLPQLAFML